MEAGLESVIAAETVLSDVDGEAGRLVLRGATLEDLAGVADFESVCTRLWAGLVPDLPVDLRAALGDARVRVWEEAARLDAGLLDLPPVEGLRALMARLPDGEDADAALRITAAPAVFTGALLRRRAGRPALAPDPSAGHAADLLRMISGEAPSAGQAAALDAYLVTVIDHGLNASTFAARVAASTRAGLVSAALAGLSALKGPLHGGAPGPVIDMLDAIGTPANARTWQGQAGRKAGDAAAVEKAVERQQTRTVSGRTFFDNGGQWVDARVQDRPGARRERVTFGSDAYFALLDRDPSAARWLAQGRNVIVLVGDTVYEVVE